MVNLFETPATACCKRRRALICIKARPLYINKLSLPYILWLYGAVVNLLRTILEVVEIEFLGG